METHRIQISTAIEAVKKGVALFDVRTPAEFEKGHVPGAINLPLFSNEERIVVGTAYKQNGRHPALLLALDFIGPKMRRLVEDVEKQLGSPKNAAPFMVHCWRGGMRSASVAWLLSTYDYEISVVEGGYKSYRNWALEEFEKDVRLIVLGGHTGAGKTELLHDLKEKQHFVIDLEGLANHRGSAFGALGLPDQPTQQQFENDLAMELSENGGRLIWLEDESRNVGRRRIPGTLYEKMRESPVIFVKKSVSRRLDFLVGVYGSADREALKERFVRIEKRIGLEKRKQAEDFLEAGDIRGAAGIALEYYDKSYEYGLSKRKESTLTFLDVDDDLPTPDIVEKIINLAQEITRLS